MQRSRVFEDPTPERSGLIFNTTWVPACSATTAYPVGALQQPELLHHLVGGDERRGRDHKRPPRGSRFSPKV
jgi:hypothetical protein